MSIKEKAVFKCDMYIYTKDKTYARDSSFLLFLCGIFSKTNINMADHNHAYVLAIHDHPIIVHYEVYMDLNSVILSHNQTENVSP
jgi:hypothetical protein